MSIDLSRRGFLGGLLSAFAAPAIVRAASLMPVKVMPSADELDALCRAPYEVTGTDLVNVVRRAFVPRIYMQVYSESPLMMHLYEQAPAGRLT